MDEKTVASKLQQAVARAQTEDQVLEILVVETAAKDWEKFLAFLETQKYSYALNHDGEAKKLQEVKVEDLLDEASLSLLKIDLGAFALDTFFHDEEEIELNIIPEDEVTENDLKQLIGFLKGIGDHTEKPVILRMEGAGESVMAYTATGGFIVD